MKKPTAPKPPRVNLAATTAPHQAATVPGDSTLADVELARILEPEHVARVFIDGDALLELAASMKEIGLLNPIRLHPRDKLYEIESGHRRFLAAKMLGWLKIRALIVKEGALGIDAGRLHENAFREDMTAAEEAIYYRDLVDRKQLTEDQLCALVHQSPDYIGDRLRLLRQCPKVFDALLQRQIKFGVARELNKITDEAMRVYYLQLAIDGGHNQRTVTAWVTEWKQRGSPSVPVVETPTTPEEVAAPGATVYACAFCGGDKDPYNLISVFIHKWELAAVLEALKRSEA